MKQALGLGLCLLSCIPVAHAAAVQASVEYTIDINADPDDEGLVTLTTSNPGQTVEIVHPEGKGLARGVADYGSLGAEARLDPDFPTDQMSRALAYTHFEDELTISGSNVGAFATVTFELRVQGTIEQPFYVSEVTGYATAYAGLHSSTEFDYESDQENYHAQGPEPIFATYDDTLTVSVSFLVGQAIFLSANLTVVSEADLAVHPNAEEFAADFFGGAVLQPIQLTGVDDALITSTSGHTYPLEPADGSSGRVANLRLAKTAGPNLTLTWQMSCLATDTDYAVYEGTLGAWESHGPYTCSTAGATSASVLPPSNSAYYLIVPLNDVTEGSYGTTSFEERSPSEHPCKPQLIGGCP